MKQKNQLYINWISVFECKSICLVGIFFILQKSQWMNTIWFERIVISELAFKIRSDTWHCDQLIILIILSHPFCIDFFFQVWVGAVDVCENQNKIFSFYFLSSCFSVLYFTVIWVQFTFHKKYGNIHLHLWPTKLNMNFPCTPLLLNAWFIYFCGNFRETNFNSKKITNLELQNWFDQDSKIPLRLFNSKNSF